MNEDAIPPTIAWAGDRVRLIDQRLLPGRLAFIECRTVEELCDAICTLAIRGAPALGAAGGFGVALATLAARRESTALDAAARAADQLSATRPTAVNLAWGARRVLAAANSAVGDGVAGVRRAAVEQAERIAAEDVDINRNLGRKGSSLVPPDANILTHCNAGALACVGYGTALGVIRAAAEIGRVRKVWVDETRPVLQGARLTAWELDRLGIDATVVADVMAGSLMAAGSVDLVVVGADRIAANGDVANKIGSYSLAVLAAHHDVPFYVAAPMSTIDMATPNGAAIPVEERSEDEVTRIGGRRMTPKGTHALNWAFDVTPAALITAIVTERGILRAPYDSAIPALLL